MHFEQHNWPNALTAYQSAIAAGDDLLASAYSEAGRQSEVSETAPLFANSCYCLLQIHQYGEAFVTLERGKTRLLAEALAFADLDVLSLPKQYRDPLQGARQSVKALEAKMRLRTDISGTVDLEGPSPVAQLREKRAELATLIETIRQAEAIADVLGAKPLLNSAATTSAVKSGAAGAAYMPQFSSQT